MLTIRRAIISNRVPNEEESDFITWRNYTLTNVSGIVGPLIAGSLANIKCLGRKYTMVIGALLTMTFFFGYTGITTAAQNVAFSCVIGLLTPNPLGLVLTLTRCFFSQPAV